MIYSLLQRVHDCKWAVVEGGHKHWVKVVCRGWWWWWWHPTKQAKTNLSQSLWVFQWIQMLWATCSPQPGWSSAASCLGNGSFLSPEHFQDQYREQLWNDQTLVKRYQLVNVHFQHGAAWFHTLSNGSPYLILTIWSDFIRTCLYNIEH